MSRALFVPLFGYLQIAKHKSLQNTPPPLLFEERRLQFATRDMSFLRYKPVIWRPVRACATETPSSECSGNRDSVTGSERIPLSKLRYNVLYEGTVTKLFKFGFLVDIGAQRNAFVHISEVKVGYVANLSNEVKLGQRIFVVLRSINPNEGRIEGSVKAAQKLLAAGIYDLEISRLTEWGTIEKQPYKEVCGNIDEYYQDEDFTEVLLKTRRYF